MPSTQVQPAPLAPLRRRPSSDFSMPGLLYCAMIMFMGLAAYNTQANLIFAIFGLMIGIMIFSFVAGRQVVRRLAIRRIVPPYLVVGAPTALYYEITNQKRYWPSLSVTLTELNGTGGFDQAPQAYMLHTSPGQTASVPCEVLPKRRGVYELNEFQLTSAFPFGFIKRSLRQRQREAIAIYPAVAEVERRLLSMCRAADQAGESARARPGGTDEFYGVRQYRAGDNPRWMHWRRSARTGQLVMREMTRVAPPRLVILADTFIHEPTPRAHGAVERAIAMAASLASAALDDGLSVGICAWAGDVVALEPARGKQQCDEILALLTRLPRNIEFPFEKLVPAGHRLAGTSATIVALTASNVTAPPAMDQRSRQIVLSASSIESQRWFHFPPDIDFEGCLPLDQLESHAVDHLKNAGGLASATSAV